MTDAVKRAAGALHTHRTGRDNTICVDSDESPASCWPLAHIALAAALSDREGMARVLAEATSESGFIYDGQEGDGYEYTRRKYRRVADAVIAHLIGEGKA